MRSETRAIAGSFVEIDWRVNALGAIGASAFWELGRAFGSSNVEDDLAHLRAAIKQRESLASIVQREGAREGRG